MNLAALNGGCGYGCGCAVFRCRRCALLCCADDERGGGSVVAANAHVACKLLHKLAYITLVREYRPIVLAHGLTYNFISQR
jgi:hypothetical protein